MRCGDLKNADASRTHTAEAKYHQSLKHPRFSRRSRIEQNNMKELGDTMVAVNLFPIYMGVEVNPRSIYPILYGKLIFLKNLTYWYIYQTV